MLTRRLGSASLETKDLVPKPDAQRAERRPTVGHRSLRVGQLKGLPSTRAGAPLMYICTFSTKESYTIVQGGKVVAVSFK
jgi:hypothetical protein